MAVPLYLLRVYAFGLIAYVTGSTNEVKLLLVDARHPPVATDGCPISKHDPVLLYEPHKGKCNDWCSLALNVCRCPLDRVRVSFKGIPFAESDTFDQRDLKYVPALLGFEGGRRIKAECLYSTEKVRVCPFVTAQTSLVPQRFHACEMARGATHDGYLYGLPRREDRTQEGGMFSFRSASQGEFELFRQQQIGIKNVLVRELSYDEVNGKEFLKVTVISYDDTFHPRAVRIYPEDCPEDITWPIKVPRDKKDDKNSGKLKRKSDRAKCFDLAIANVPFHANQHLLYGRCQAHGIDRDFELFEDLTRTQQDLEDREVPFDRRTSKPKEAKRDALCDSALLEDFNRWLRTDQATSECSGGRIRN